MSENNNEKLNQHSNYDSKISEIWESMSMLNDSIKGLMKTNHELQIRDTVHTILFKALFKKLLNENDKKQIYEVLFKCLDRNSIEKEEVLIKERSINYLNTLFDAENK
ncbi:MULTISPECIES: hypothetical protein [Enterobacterales]|uniref:hypothetical protein n=1 Tax=Enterobacterales TaxID=91347 RepID=UPI000847FC24|nr:MULTISPECIES: hypothetical protein [unclassified Shigella]ODQ08182.1 hypothetical protein BGK50_12755 [Shigella sp. FC130]OEI93357.1 hypothetical protein BHE86_18000 [Shigella sp. FC1655]OEJ08016.1 hypothetical protein BHE89_14550 [Shigella sp. FC1967]